MNLVTKEASGAAAVITRVIPLAEIAEMVRGNDDFQAQINDLAPGVDPLSADHVAISYAPARYTTGGNLISEAGLSVRIRPAGGLSAQKPRGRKPGFRLPKGS